MTHEIHAHIRSLLQNDQPRDSKKQQLIDSHLATCAECQAYAVLLADLATGEWSPHRPKILTSAAVDSLQQRILPRRQPLRWRPTLNIQSVDFALGAVGLLLIGVLGWQLWQPLATPSGMEAAASTATPTRSYVARATLEAMTTVATPTATAQPTRYPTIGLPYPVTAPPDRTPIDPAVLQDAVAICRNNTAIGSGATSIKKVAYYFDASRTQWENLPLDIITYPKFTIQGIEPLDSQLRADSDKVAFLIYGDEYPSSSADTSGGWDYVNTSKIVYWHDGVEQTVAEFEGESIFSLGSVRSPNGDNAIYVQSSMVYTREADFAESPQALVRKLDLNQCAADNCVSDPLPAPSTRYFPSPQGTHTLVWDTTLQLQLADTDEIIGNGFNPLWLDDTRFVYFAIDTAEQSDDGTPTVLTLVEVGDSAETQPILTRQQAKDVLVTAGVFAPTVEGWLLTDVRKVENGLLVNVILPSSNTEQFVTSSWREYLLFIADDSYEARFLLQTNGVGGWGLTTLSSDGRFLAVLGPDELAIHNLVTGEIAYYPLSERLDGFWESGIKRYSFSPNGQLLMLLQPEEIAFVQLDTGAIQTFALPDQWRSCLTGTFMGD